MTQPERPTPIDRYLGIAAMAAQTCGIDGCDEPPNQMVPVLEPAPGILWLCNEHAEIASSEAQTTQEISPTCFQGEMGRPCGGVATHVAMIETDNSKIGLLSLCDSHATKAIHKLNHPDSVQPELLILGFPNPAPHVQLHLITPAGETIPVVLLPQEARRIAHSIEEAADKAEDD